MNAPKKTTGPGVCSLDVDTQRESKEVVTEKGVS
jgi:hypothetical protein